MFSDKQIADLSASLDGRHVKTRRQSNRDLSYIEAWHAIAEANRIFGFDGWNRQTLETKLVAERERKMSSGKDGWSVSYTARVLISVTAGSRIVTREGTGAGHGIDVDLGLAHESAIKEAESDAMKRALTTFGYPFGLALYDKTQEHVDRGGNGHRDAPSVSSGPIGEALEQRAMAAATNGMVAYETFFKALPHAGKRALTESGTHDKCKEAASYADRKAA